MADYIAKIARGSYRRATGQARGSVCCANGGGCTYRRGEAETEAGKEGGRSSTTGCRDGGDRGQAQKEEKEGSRCGGVIVAFVLLRLDLLFK